MPQDHNLVDNYDSSLHKFIKSGAYSFHKLFIKGNMCGIKRAIGKSPDDVGQHVQHKLGNIIQGP